MRLLLFLNNWGSWQLARWLREEREEIVGLVIQPEEDQRFASEILQALDLPSDRVWRAPQLRDPQTVTRIRQLQPDIGLSSFFGYVLRPDVLALPSHGCINLHPAYLPFNRGWHTNVWPIIDGSPAGVSIHYMDTGVDTGDLITQRLIAVQPTDTGGSLHQKLTRALITLFKETWPLIKNGRHVRTPQNTAIGSSHKRAELSTIDEVHLTKRYRARDLIDLLRARTYPPFPGAYFVAESRKTYIRVQFDENAEFRDTPTANFTKESPRLELDQGYTAEELLKLLSTDKRGAHFYELGRTSPIFVRAVLLSEESVDPRGIPAWD